MTGNKSKQQTRFDTTDRSAVPSGRNGKHKAIVSAILADLEGLEKGRALKIPLSELPDSKINIRSALNRATHKMNKAIATAADQEFLYVWNA
jgi:hypothetical protein